MKFLVTLLVLLGFTFGIQANLYADSHGGEAKTTRVDMAKDHGDKEDGNKKQDDEEEPDCE